MCLPLYQPMENTLKTIFPQSLMISFEKKTHFLKFSIIKVCLVQNFQSRMKKRQLLRIKSVNFPDNFGTLALSLGKRTNQIGR